MEQALDSEETMSASFSTNGLKNHFSHCPALFQRAQRHPGAAIAEYLAVLVFLAGLGAPRGIAAAAAADKVDSLQCAVLHVATGKTLPGSHTA
jgi:hypothetical protein